MAYLGNPPPVDIIQDTKKDIFEFIALEGDTVFGGYDINNKLLGYIPGLLVISFNGSWLDAADYTATDGTTITLTTAVGVGTDQTIKVLTFDSYDVINTYTKKQVDDKIDLAVGTSKSKLYEYTAIQDQTTFTGVDDNAETLSYKTGFILVIMNGVVLDSAEYTANDTTSVILVTAANDTDIVNILSFGTFLASESYTKDEVNVKFIDKITNDSVGATELEWIEINLNGTVGYIRVYATK